jgi:hypothetical protein
MRQGWRWWTTGALAALLILPAAAQREEQAPTGASPEVATLLEDVAVLRAVNPLRLTGTQLAALVALLEAGAAQAGAAEAADVPAWIAASRTLKQAIPQAAAGAPTTTADAELARVEGATRSKVEAARRKTRDEVRALLQKALSPAQMAALDNAGRAEIAARRMARLEDGDARMLDRYGRQLDRLREATPAEYARERQRFAGQIAALPGGGVIRRENRVENRAGRTGARGGERDGLRIEQERIARRTQRMETREQLADPARRAQYSQALATADQIRAMAPALYARQRGQLSLQMLQAMNQTRAQSASAEEATNTFIERYFLSPRAAIVLRERQQAMGG